MFFFSVIGTIQMRYDDDDDDLCECVIKLHTHSLTSALTNNVVLPDCQSVLLYTKLMHSVKIMPYTCLWWSDTWFGVENDIQL